MGFLKNIIRNAVSDGISRGIGDAISKATEKIIAPKAEEYANKAADSFDSAAKELDNAAAAAGEEAADAKTSSSLSSLEQSLNRMSAAAERYAAAMEKTVESQEDFIKEWNEKLPGFPVWCFGGKDFRLEENGNAEDGGIYYVFFAENATQEGLDMYIALLKENGFVRKYSTSDEVLYKDLGGEYLVLGTTDAFGTDPVMALSMVRTKDRHEIEY